MPPGVTHVPGLADSILNELAPLLAAEGIDLSDPKGVDIDALQAALGPAVERRNMELFTPTGAHRTQALAVLRRFTETTAAGRADEAQAVLDGVETDETEDHPAISHVIGVTLGLLDSWYADRRLRTALSSARIASRRRSVRASATDLLAAARRNTAFSSLDELTITHGGLDLFEGGATLIAASISAIAKRQRRSVTATCRELLIADPEYTSVDVVVAGTGRAAETDGTTPADERTLAEFEEWLARQPHIVAPTVEDEATAMRAIFGLARTSGADLRNPHDIETAVDLLVDMGSGEGPDSYDSMMSCLLTLDEYIHFQWEISRRPENWDHAHDIVEDALSAGNGGDRLADVIENATATDPRVRHAALMKTRVSTAVPAFLGWLSTSRAISQSGNLRLVDIEPVAALLGVRAEGVRKLPPLAHALPSGFGTDEPLPEPETLYATSMRDVAVLWAWWQALLQCDIIETTATRVRPGPASGPWTDGGEPPIEDVEALNGLFVSFLLSDRMFDDDQFGSSAAVAVLASRIVIAAAAPELGIENPSDAMSAILRPRALQVAARLERLGLMSRDASGKLEVPAGLKAAVLRGAMIIMEIVTRSDET